MSSANLSTAARDRRVRRDLYLEGLANLGVLAAKTLVGFATGSLAILGDALHSLTDVVNNVVALIVMHHAAEPPDEKHPYGHRKFETLAVFVLAVLLTVIAFELVIRGISAEDREVERNGWALAVMLGVLVVNVLVAAWQSREARTLNSDILAADAKHTFADVMTTVVVITGWQVAASGHSWVDTLAAFLVAGIVLHMAFQLFQRAIPVLVDESAIEPDALRDAVDAVPGVLSVRRARSRSIGERASVDVTVIVERDLSAIDAHSIADAVEDAVREAFGARDVSVHVEPVGEETEMLEI